ncbi:MAG: hypothetical protein J6X78_01655 [Treponema sp.]|nr:hypothetical protein [Treponema sp.]
MQLKKIFIPILFLLFTSCNTDTLRSFFFDTNEEEDIPKEKKYNPDIIWRLNTETYIENYPVQEGQYLYIQELPAMDKINIAKIDLSMGTYVWKSDIVRYANSYGGCVTDKYYCFFDFDNYLKIFNKETGYLITTVIMSENEKEREAYAPYTTSLFFYNDALYWGNAANETDVVTGIMKLDLNNIDYNTRSQILNPECVYQLRSDEGFFSSKFIIDGDILYGLTYNTNYFNSGYKGSAFLFSFDIKTFEIKWRKQIDNICGFNPECIKLDGDKLFIFDVGIFCFDKKTGNFIFSKEQTSEDLKKEIHLSASLDLCGIYQCNGKFYYTRNAYVGSNEQLGRPEKYNKNIICWDGNTFKLAWGDLPPYKEGSSLQTRPVVVNRKCFVVTNTGLRVYDADTGEFFGVWRDIKNLGRDLNASYKNMFIFFDHDKNTGKGILTAINAG